MKQNYKYIPYSKRNPIVRNIDATLVDYIERHIWLDIDEYKIEIGRLDIPHSRVKIYTKYLQIYMSKNIADVSIRVEWNPHFQSVYHSDIEFFREWFTTILPLIRNKWKRLSSQQ